MATHLTRRLGLHDAVVIGLGSMIGAGVFAAFAPAARAAGSGLLLGLALAAVVAYCNATSSARLYWESFADPRGPITAPSGLSVYPRDIVRPSRRDAEQRFTDLRWYAEMPHGGHFAALEQPGILVEQLRTGLRALRR